MGFMAVYPIFKNYQIQYLRDIILKSYGSIFFITCYLIFKMKIFFDFKKSVSILIENKFFVFLAILAFFSTLWSQDPIYTSTKTIIFIFYSFTALFVLNYNKSSVITKALNISLVFLLISSLIVSVLNLNTNNAVSGEAWLGIFNHKNNLGYVSAFAAIFFLFQNSKLSWLIKYIIIILAVCLMIKAQSATAFASLAITITVIPFFWKIKKKVLRPSLLATVYVAMFFLTMFSSMLPNSLFEVLGKDSTLTGRDKVYSSILYNVSGYKTLIGFGAGSYFKQLDDANSFQNSINKTKTLDQDLAKTETGFSASHAHNQVLQFYAELGLTGVILYFCFLWSTFKKIRLMSRFHFLFPELKLLTGLLFFTFISTQSEDRLSLYRISLLWLPLLWIHAIWNRRKELIQKQFSLTF